MAFDIGSGFTAAVTTFLQTGNPYAAVAAFVIGGFVGGDAKRSARNKARSAFNDAQRDRDQMVQSATAPHKIVYGRARVSGPIAYAQSTGSKGEFLHLVVVLAGHECDAVETVYFNDTPLTLDGSGNTTDAAFIRTVLTTTTQSASAVSGATTVITLANVPIRVLSVVAPDNTNFDVRNTTVNAAYTLVGSVVTVTNPPGALVGDQISVLYEYTASATPLVQVKSYLGTATQTADAGLVSASGGKWTSAHRLRGLCYVYVRLEYDQDVFGATGLPDVSAVVRGRKLWDPRTGTTVWRANAALCAADYLRNYMGAAAVEVPDAELTIEANACDELVTIATGVTEARYTCNGALSTDEAPRDNLEAIVEAMAGSVAWAQGRYIIRAGRHPATELTITEDMLADGPISIQPDAARTELTNRVVAKYIEPAKAYTTIEAPPVTNATYVTDDGGLDLPTDVTLDMVNGAMRAQRLAKIMLERNRQGMRVQLKCNLKAYDLVPGSVVAVTIARYGWSSKLFVVTDRAHDFGAGTVALTLRETAAAVWDWAFGAATTVDLTPNTSLPNAFAKPAALAGLAVASGTTWLQRLQDGSIQCRANVTWTQTADVQVLRGGRIEVRYSRADAVTWVQAPTVAGDATSAVVGPLEEGWPTIFAVRAITGAGVAGPWAYIGHAPVGKSQAPSNVTSLATTVVQGGVQIAWAAPVDIDYAFTELRRGASWAAGVALDGSAVTSKPTRLNGSTLLWAWPAVGSYTLWAAHVDTSGNVSTTPASVAVVVDSAMSVVWSGITGTGKPADNATVGAQAGINLKDSAGTVLADAAVKNTAITVNANGTLSGAGSGQVSLTSLPGSVATGQISVGAATDVIVTSGTAGAISRTTNGVTASTVNAGSTYTNTTAAAITVTLIATVQACTATVGATTNGLGEITLNTSISGGATGSSNILFNGTSGNTSANDTRTLTSSVSLPAGATLTYSIGADVLINTPLTGALASVDWGVSTLRLEGLKR